MARVARSYSAKSLRKNHSLRAFCLEPTRNRERDDKRRMGKLLTGKRIRYAIKVEHAAAMKTVCMLPA